MPEKNASPLDTALGRVGDRWSLLIVDALLAGSRRFGDLHEIVPGIATNVLSQRLRKLEAERVVLAKTYSDRPVRYEYELTATGRELAGALRLLAQWGAAHTDESEVQRHSACGSPLEARWFCPTCERAVDSGEGDDLYYA